MLIRDCNYNVICLVLLAHETGTAHACASLGWFGDGRHTVAQVGINNVVTQDVGALTALPTDDMHPRTLGMAPSSQESL